MTRLISAVTNGTVSRITSEMTLGDDLGLDSLGRVELLAAIEADCGIYLDEEAISAETTVRQLQELLDVHEASTRPNFPAWPLYRTTQALRAAVQVPAFGVLQTIAPARVVGADRFAQSGGPALLVANHSSHLDSITILSALPPEVRARVAVRGGRRFFFSKRWLAFAVELV